MTTPVDDDLVAELNALASAAATKPDERDLSARLVWLVDVLIQRGQLTESHRKIISKLNGGGLRVKLAQFDDKRALPSPDIDCAANMHLCLGRCCSFNVSLSEEDLAAGKLRWDLSNPYVLRKDPSTAFCENRQSDGGCGVYHDRPATCRVYDCRDDQRVWIDYEKRIAAPFHAPVVPLDPNADGR